MKLYIWKHQAQIMAHRNNSKTVYFFPSCERRNINQDPANLPVHCSQASILSTYLLLSSNIYVRLPVPWTYSPLVFLNITILYSYCPFPFFFFFFSFGLYSFVCFTSFLCFIPSELDDIYTASVQICFLAQWLSAFYLCCYKFPPKQW